MKRGLLRVKSRSLSRAVYPEQSEGQSRGFALIYVLLLMALIGITIFATWAAGMADIRLSRKTESSTEAYQLAKSAIDDGWVQYKSDPTKNVPDETAACNATNPKVLRVNPNANPISSEIKNLRDPILASVSQAGIYDVRVCVSGTSDFIEGIGYYKGNKITLRGDIGTGDKLTIYQKGPSN